MKTSQKLVHKSARDGFSREPMQQIEIEINSLRCEGKCIPVIVSSLGKSNCRSCRYIYCWRRLLLLASFFPLEHFINGQLAFGTTKKKKLRRQQTWRLFAASFAARRENSRESEFFPQLSHTLVSKDQRHT